MNLDSEDVESDWIIFRDVVYAAANDLVTSIRTEENIEENNIES